MLMAGRRRNVTLNISKLIFIKFSVYASKFRWTTAYILAIFALFEAPYFGWHEHQRCTVAKYHDYGQLRYVLFLQP